MRLTRVDDLLRSQHRHLRPADECWFLREYTSRAGHEHSETNSVISNLKKAPDRREMGEWKYKAQAIERVARELSAVLNPRALRRMTLIPVPPSRAKDDPLHDDRLTRVLREIGTPAGLPGGLDVRELLIQRRSCPPAHAAAVRPGPDELAAGYEVDARQAAPPPRALILFDDVLTTGAHFVAASAVLATRFPGTPITGLFYARRALTSPVDPWATDECLGESAPIEVAAACAGRVA